MLRQQWNQAFSGYLEKLIPMEVTTEPSCNQRRLAEILSKQQQSKDFFHYMEQLIQMKVGEAGLDSTSSLQNTEENCGDILLDQVENIITAKLKPTDGKEMLDIISEATSNVSEGINRELNSLVAQMNSINEGSGIITPPVIEEKEKSKIRTELIKIFQIDTEILKKLTAAIFQVDKQILKDHGEEIWRAISLIKSKPQDPLHYLKEFKLAMETLPLDLRSKLVPIIYEKPLRNIPDYIQRDSKNNPTLEFGPGCDLSGYYLRDLSFRHGPGCDDWETALSFRSAKMIRADLSKSNFSSLVLNEADLTEANLTHTNFIGSKLIGTKLSGAYWEEGLNKKVLILGGSRVSNPYWEQAQPPLIDNTTRFIPDDLINGVGKALWPLNNLDSLIRTENQAQIGDITLPLKNNTLKNVEIIKNAFKGVTSKMKEHILNNIGPFQRRALEAILAYKDPKEKITAATDIPLILPDKKLGLIIIPDENERESMLEAGMTAANLIQEKRLGEQSLQYNLAPINQQAALNNLAKVSANHTKRDFSKLGITLLGTSFDQAILDSANLSRQDLSEAVFNECRLIKTDLSGTKLQNTIFNNCDLSEVDLSKAKMQGTTFHNCNLSKSTWEKALMDGVSMINCTIKDVDIEEMTSHNWFLDHCILDNVNFKSSEEGKGIFINQMGLISSIIVNSNIEGNTNFYNVEGIGSVLAVNDPAKKLLNKDLTMSPLSYVSNSPIQIALEAVFQQGSRYSQAFQNVEDNGVNFGPVDLMDLSGLSRAAIGYQPQRFARIDQRLLKSMP
jgi:uncharacterized protein YjbI with pentapeptide repeats